MMKVAILLLSFVVACLCWDTPLPQVAIAGSTIVNFDNLYVLSETQANTNATGSRNGRIGTQIVISATQPVRNLSLEIRMYAIKTADVWHTHVPNEILCVSEGNGVFTSSSGEQWPMAPGDCTFMSGSTSHYFQSYNTNATSNFTILTNTFLPAPFQRTDNASLAQNWTYPATPLRTTFSVGKFGQSGQATRDLSTLTSSTSLVSTSDTSISYVVATSGQVVNNAALTVDTNIYVQKGGLNVNAGGVSYAFRAGDFFVLPANTPMNASANGAISLLVFNSPPTSQLISFSTPATSTTTTTTTTAKTSTTSGASTVVASLFLFAALFVMF